MARDLVFFNKFLIILKINNILKIQGRYGIRVVTLAPGIFVTPMSDHIQKKYIELYK